MKSPFTGGEVTLQIENRILNYRKEEFEVMYHFYECKDTSEHFTDEELDTVNTNQIYNQYRVKYGIPFPDEIKEIREKYGLSANKMSEVLGFGANVYRNYEAGEVPSISNGKFLRQIQNGEVFKNVLETSNQFTPEELKKLKLKIDLGNQGWNDFGFVFERYLMGDKNPNEFTGYRSPHLEKIANMVMYFADDSKPFKTKLNKLLFYADFLHFKKTCFSISGATYKAIQLGPVPKNFGGLYDYATEHGYVHMNPVYFESGNVGEQFIANAQKSFDEDMFSDSEKFVLKYIADSFRNCTVKEIVDRSHEEIAWKKNAEGFKEISYLDGFELKSV